MRDIEEAVDFILGSDFIRANQTLMEHRHILALLQLDYNIKEALDEN